MLARKTGDDEPASVDAHPSVHAIKKIRVAMLAKPFFEGCEGDLITHTNAPGKLDVADSSRRMGRCALLGEGEE